jgi:hypothetical protein
MQAMNVPAVFEPLRLRPPLETWFATSDEDLDRLPIGLADLLSVNDVRRIDQSLVQNAVRRSTRLIRAACDAVERKALAGNRMRISLRCSGKGQPLALRARLYVQGPRVTSGVVEGLAIEQGGPLAALDVIGGDASAQGVRVAVTGRGISARTHRGHRIEQIQLDWARQGPTATVKLREDFILAQEAALRLAGQGAQTEPNVFGPQPFQRATLIDAVVASISGTSPECCLSRAALPEPRLDQLPGKREHARAGAATNGIDLSRFYHACGRCHDTRESVPPNFLAGDAQQAQAAFRHCAQRILVRLKMWRIPAEERMKTPMPPPLGLALIGTTPDAWLAARDLDGLIDQVQAVLAEPGGSGRDDEGSAAAGYEALPRCLPESDVESTSAESRQTNRPAAGSS